MLRIFDTSHFIGIIEDQAIRNLKRTDVYEAESCMILSYLSFEVPYTIKYYRLCELENYVINCDGGIYVIKEVITTFDNWCKVTCEPNLEAWTNKLIDGFSFVVPALDNTKTIKDLMDYILSFAPKWKCIYLDSLDQHILLQNYKQYNASYKTLLQIYLDIFAADGTMISIFDTSNYTISLMSYSYWYHSYSPSGVCISSQTGLDKLAVDKNSYDLYTEYVYAKPISPILYPDGPIMGYQNMEFENPVLRSYKYIQKPIQRINNAKKITHWAQNQLETYATPSLSYTISGSLVDIKQIKVAQYIVLYDVMTRTQYYLVVDKLEYNYKTPELSKLHVILRKMDKLDEQEEKLKNALEAVKEALAEQLEDEIEKFDVL